jgi:hypothetical protein
MPLRQPPTLTPALLAANRRNAQKSTGPRTEEGKRRVRLNGLKHGRWCRSFRESLIKWGESTALVDRNFLFFTFLLLPRKRYQARRIAEFVRALWSLTHFQRRRQVRAATPDRQVKKLATEVQLEALLSDAERRVAELGRLCRSGLGNARWGLPPSTSRETSPVPSSSDLELLHRTGPILLPGLAPPELPTRPRLVRSRQQRNEAPKPECRMESTTSIFRPPRPISKGDEMPGERVGTNPECALKSIE